MSKLLETEDDVLSAITEIRTNSGGIVDRQHVYAAMDVINQQFKQPHENFYQMDYRALFLKTGRFADHELFYAMAEEFNTPAFCQLMLKKNAAYGDEPIRRWGPIGNVIRIDSKLSRFRTLTRPDAPDNLGEAVTDTLTDILGYSVLGLRLLKEYA